MIDGKKVHLDGVQEIAESRVCHPHLTENQPMCYMDSQSVISIASLFLNRKYFLSKSNMF